MAREEGWMHARGAVCTGRKIQARYRPVNRVGYTPGWPTEPGRVHAAWGCAPAFNAVVDDGVVPALLAKVQGSRSKGGLKARGHGASPAAVRGKSRVRHHEITSVSPAEARQRWSPARCRRRPSAGGHHDSRHRSGHPGPMPTGAAARGGGTARSAMDEPLPHRRVLARVHTPARKFA